jgi:ubiquinone/menaquinone biosynthesis C-methylase UbiE/DNA-binding transcriptional ArsR family regulator
MVIADVTLPAALRLLADPTRLRILALLEREELSVGELCDVLGMAQSRVSNHLRLLRDASLLHERHAGTSTHVRLDGNGDTAAARLFESLRDDVAAMPEHAADLVRLDALIARRRAKNGDFFDRVAGQWDKLAGAFRSGQARHRLANHLLPREFVVADVGCGTGYVAEALLGVASKVICIDRSEKMIAEAKKRFARGRGATEVEFRRGDLDDLPLEDGEVDGVVAGMVLHHLPRLDGAVAEMFRGLAPGGAAALLELAPHKEAWMRRDLGDRHLGLEAKDVLAALKRVGFVEAVLDPVDDHYQPKRNADDPVSLPLYIARGRKPAHPV